MHLIRKISRNWQWVLINVIGLSMAFSCVALVFSFASHELSYDRFHSKANRIYRATTSSGDFSTMHPARVWGKWVPELPEQYPEVENFVRMVPFKKGVVQIGEHRFYSDNLFKVDSSFFDIYDFELLSGDRKSVLTNPQETVITKSMALKYFGSLDVLGKQIEIMHQQRDTAFPFTIVGVMQDFPANSHFHAEALTTIPDMEVNSSWGYTYYLMKEGTDVEALQRSIQQQWDAELQDGQVPKMLHLQKLTDIHLHSHKTREIETNGDIRSIVLLASGGVIILFIALINFLNLNKVQFIAYSKSIQIRMIHGAGKKEIASQLIAESLVISLTTILLGSIISYRLGSYLDVNILSPLTLILLISLIFILVIGALSILPLYTSKIATGTKVSKSGSGLYTFPLVIQFTLAVIAIVGTIVLHRQMNFLNDQHPQAQNKNIVVIERNPWNVVQRYERFKKELLKDPSIINMTGAMEEPGGDILDNFRFEMEGIVPNDKQTLYILTTDPNFIKSLGVKPLAGSIDLGYTPNQQWESYATELSTLEQMGNPNPVRAEYLREEIKGYREKYILNESALKMLGIEDPKDAIGRSFRLTFSLPHLFPEGSIVAVVPDFHYTNLHKEERPMVIAPRKMFNYNFLIQLDPRRKKKALLTIKKTWEEINPEFPFTYGYINDSYEKVYATEHAQTRVLSLFALISIILSALGIYAIAAFSMQRRVKEIGIRKVNGATIFEIMFMLNKKFLIWVVLAFIVATPIAWYAMRKWLESFAYKTDLSWWIFALAGIAAMLVALLTVSIQSYRAASRNPVDSLRYE